LEFPIDNPTRAVFEFADDQLAFKENQQQFWNLEVVISKLSNDDVTLT
jgi:hypothetical protein